jgi:uncharacterized RDD family membrane protein YckC
VSAPSLLRRLACNVYETLLLLAVLLIATFPVAALTRYLPPDLGTPLLRVWMLGIAGGYLAIFWHKGQTLAMKTWRIRLTAENGGQPSWSQVWLRYALALLNLALLGSGWWAAIFREDRQFLQDRYAGTRLLRE